MFKIGDRVKRTDNGFACIPLGTGGSVMSAIRNGYCDVDYDNGMIGYLTNINYIQLISMAAQIMAFKIGDRVRRTGKDVPGFVMIGEQGTVADLDIQTDPNKSVVVVDWDNGSKNFRNLERFTELVAGPKPLAVGDRVKRIIDRSSGAIPIGKLGTITRVININSLSIKWDGDRIRDVDMDTVERIEDDSAQAPQESTGVGLAVPVSNTIPSPPPQFQDNVFCKRKYYGLGICSCGGCKPAPERYR